MRFLILGVTGLIGRHLRRLLDREGIAWLGASRAPSQARLIEFDIARDCLPDRLPPGYWEKPDATFVVHCVSFGSIDACFLQREASWAVNVAGPQRVAEELHPYGVRHVFLSTNQVFDGSRPLYREDDPPCPLNEYGRQKAAVEQFLLERSPDALVLRLDKVVSDQPDDGQLFSQWMTAANEGRPIRCVAGQRLSPTLASGVARAILAACRLGLGGVYHVANPEVFERRDLAELFLHTMSLECEIQTVAMNDLPLVEPRPLSAVLDASRFLAATEMRFTPLREAILQFRSAAADAKG